MVQVLYNALHFQPAVAFPNVGGVTGYLSENVFVPYLHF